MKIRYCAFLTVICLLSVLCFTGCESEPEITVITRPQGQAVTVPTHTVSTGGSHSPVPTSPTSNQTSVETPSASTAPVTKPTVSVGDVESSSEKGKAIAELAISLIGTPFKFGANGPDAFDNPSFVVYCYKQNGYTIPRKASAMALYGEDVPPDELQLGDILVFCNEIGEAPGFCGIYIGNNQFVSCNNPDSPTKIQKLNVSYWSERFVAARRPKAE